MRKTLNAFLKAGKENEKPKPEKEVSHLQVDNQKHRHVRPNTTPGPFASIRRVDNSFVDSRTPSSQI